MHAILKVYIERYKSLVHHCSRVIMHACMHGIAIAIAAANNIYSYSYSLPPPVNFTTL